MVEKSMGRQASVEMYLNSQLLLPSIYESQAGTYARLNNMISHTVTYARVNKNTNEIIMAPDGMPLCHITDSSDKDWNKKDWSTVGSVMIGGVDRKKVGVKVEDLKAALGNFFHYLEVRYDSGDLARFKIDANWIPVNKMMGMLDGIEEIFGKSTDAVSKEVSYVQATMVPRNDPAPRGVVTPFAPPNRGVFKRDTHTLD